MVELMAVGMVEVVPGGEVKVVETRVVETWVVSLAVPAMVRWVEILEAVHVAGGPVEAGTEVRPEGDMAVLMAAEMEEQTVAELMVVALMVACWVVAGMAVVNTAVAD